MKLFFSPGACCMSCHIALEETKLPFELVYVGKNATDGVKKEFLSINPAGAVPAVQLENGKILTQNIAILEYIADLKPDVGLIDKPGTYERAEIMRWTSFVASDLHKSFSPLFRISNITTHVEAQQDLKKWCFSNIDKYFSILENHLQDKQYLALERFTIADCYLYTVYQWRKAVDFPVERYSALNRYSGHISKRPTVMAVLQREQGYG